MTAAERQAASASAGEAVLKLLGEQKTGAIGTYVASDGEIDPQSSKERLEVLGWNFHLPVVGPSRVMTFRRWTADTRLTPNRFGIPEPGGDSSEVHPGDLDLVLVPCVAVDRTGNRIGMGAGYYDRAFDLPDEVRPEMIAVAFDFQVLPRIERSEWDVPVDAIVTESKVILTGRRDVAETGRILGRE